MQVVRHDNRVEALAFERPRAGFEIARARADPRHARHGCEGIGIAVDGDDARTSRRQPASVASAPGGKIEHARVRRNEMGEARDPRRRRQVVVIGHGVGERIRPPPLGARGFFRPPWSPAGAAAAGRGVASLRSHWMKAAASGRCAAWGAATAK